MWNCSRFGARSVYTTLHQITMSIYSKPHTLQTLISWRGFIRTALYRPLILWRGFTRTALYRTFNIVMWLASQGQSHHRRCPVYVHRTRNPQHRTGSSVRPQQSGWSCVDLCRSTWRSVPGMWCPLTWSSGCSDPEFGLSVWVFYFRRCSSAKDVFQSFRSWCTANRWQYFILLSFVVCVCIS